MRGDFTRPMASERSLNGLSQSMHPRTQQQQPQQATNRSFTGPQHIQVQSMRMPANSIRGDNQRKSMFASGERGNRYRFDPERSNGGADPERTASPPQNNNMQRQNMMQQQRMHQSMQIPMQKPNSNGSELKDGSPQNSMQRQNMMQQQRMQQSVRPNSRGSESNNSHQNSIRMKQQQQMRQSMRLSSVGSGSQNSRQRMMQQQHQMHQSMQIPRNKDLRGSWDRQRHEQLQFAQMSQRLMPTKRSSGDIQSEAANSRGAQSDGAVAGSVAPFQDGRQFFPPQQGMNKKPSFDAQSEGRRSQMQRSNLAKSMVISRTKSMANLERRSFNESDRRKELTSSISKSYQPVGRNSIHDEENRAKSTKQSLNSSVRNSGRRTTLAQNQQLNINDLLNSSIRSGGMNNSARSGNMMNASMRSSARRTSLSQNLGGSLRSGGRLSNSERSGRLSQRPGLNAHHSSIIPRRSSWERDEQNKLRASMGNVLMHSERDREFGPVNTLYADFGMQEIALDDEDLSDDDLAVGVVALHEGAQKSFTSQADKSRGSATYRSSLSKEASESGRDGERRASDRFRNIRDNLQKRNSSGWKTLSEDKPRDYRRIFIGMVIGGIVVAACIAAAIFLAPFDSGEKATNVDLEENVSEESPDGSDIPPDPVVDIEGRCSPSNIHGSVSACVHACSMAACCYPGFSGKSCFDETNLESVEACYRYRPHCDVIYAPWIDALYGRVAPPPDDLFNDASWDEVCLGDASSTSVKPFKKRYHVTELTGHQRASGEVVITQNTCELACSLGSCCFAPRAAVAGIDVYITSDGVAMNSTSGEHVEMNCMNDDNLESCLRYTEKCGHVMQNGGDKVDNDNTLKPTQSITAAIPVTYDDMVISSSASTIPAGNFEANDSNTTSDVDTNIPEASQPQYKATAKPTASRTTQPSMSPTQPAPTIPLPNINDIKEACTGTTGTILDIVDGVLNTLMKCQKVCQPGMCCFADTEASCFDSNREVCMAYSDCLVLSMTESDVSALDSTTNVPPIPMVDLSQFCSTSATSSGVLECVKSCIPSACCGATDQDSSCFDEFEETCALYGPCLELVDANGGDATSIPPTPPADLYYTCSYSNIIVDSEECTLACSAGACCMDNSCPHDDEGLINERCNLYEPCKNLLELPMPSDELQRFCDYTSPEYSEVGCSESCFVSSCCFEDEENPCWSNFEGTCISYAPYCAPALMEIDVAIIELQSAPTDLNALCVGASPSPECQQACSVASCCFSQEDINCWASNEQTCGEYSPCAFLYVDYQEGEDQFT